MLRALTIERRKVKAKANAGLTINMFGNARKRRLAWSYAADH